MKKPSERKQPPKHTFSNAFGFLWDYADHPDSGPLTKEFINWSRAIIHRNQWNRYRSYRESLDPTPSKARGFAWTFREALTGNAKPPRGSALQEPRIIIGTFGPATTTPELEELALQIAEQMPELIRKAQQDQKFLAEQTKLLQQAELINHVDNTKQLVDIQAELQKMLGNAPQENEDDDDASLAEILDL